MASTTWVVIEADPPFICCTSSLMPDMPAFRDSGSNLLSIRYCLSADRSRPERSLRSLRRYSYSSGVTGGLSGCSGRISEEYRQTAAPRCECQSARLSALMTDQTSDAADDHPTEHG